MWDCSVSLGSTTWSPFKLLIINFYRCRASAPPFNPHFSLSTVGRWGTREFWQSSNKPREVCSKRNQTMPGSAASFVRSSRSVQELFHVISYEFQQALHPPDGWCSADDLLPVPNEVRLVGAPPFANVRFGMKVSLNQTMIRNDQQTRSYACWQAKVCHGYAYNSTFGIENNCCWSPSKCVS